MLRKASYFQVLSIQWGRRWNFAFAFAHDKCRNPRKDCIKFFQWCHGEKKSILHNLYFEYFSPPLYLSCLSAPDRWRSSMKLFSIFRHECDVPLFLSLIISITRLSMYLSLERPLVFEVLINLDDNLPELMKFILQAWSIFSSIFLFFFVIVFKHSPITFHLFQINNPSPSFVYSLDRENSIGVGWLNEEGRSIEKKNKETRVSCSHALLYLTFHQQDTCLLPSPFLQLAVLPLLRHLFGIIYLWASLCISADKIRLQLLPLDVSHLAK